MAFPAATITCYHTCPAYDGNHAHTGGPVIQGSATVFLNGKNACRMGDPVQCDSAAVDQIAGASTSVFINGLPAARLGDPTVHGGVIVEGILTILIG